MPLPQIPERPGPDDVAWARHLVLERVLRDFCWRGPADKASYVAMLVTQVIRRWLRGAPVPLLMATATDAGAGKTLLVTICGVLYGLVKMAWTDDEAELRKQLTTVMLDQSGVISFDNVPRGTVIRSATLSKLLTDRTWGDWLLGGNALGKFANDRSGRSPATTSAWAGTTAPAPCWPRWSRDRTPSAGPGSRSGTWKAGSSTRPASGTC